MAERYLLDTNIFLHVSAGNDKRISKKVRYFLNNSSALYVSYVTFWEIGTLINIGRSKASEGIADKAHENGLNLLELKLSHIQTYSALPLIHRDPFDRMLIAQAKAERMTIITTDPVFQSYDVNVIINV